MHCIIRQLSLTGHLAWIASIFAAYLMLGWLFGTYSLLAWRKVQMVALLRRQSSAVVSLLIC